jgi:hypothetical protein
VLILRRNGAGVAFPIVSILLRRGTGIDAAAATVEADAASRVVFDPGVIGVMDVLVVYAIYRGVVVKMIVFPPAAFVATAAITVPVIDSTIISNVRAPITFME